MARYELVDDASSKYWEIVLNGTETRVSHGKLGSISDPLVKAFPAPEVARKEYEKLVAEKVKKGYRLVPPPVPGQVNLYGRARELVHPWRGSAYCRPDFELGTPSAEMQRRLGELVERRRAQLKAGLASTDGALRPLAERTLRLATDTDPLPSVEQAAVTIAYANELLRAEGAREQRSLEAWLVESKGLAFTIEAAALGLDYVIDDANALVRSYDKLDRRAAGWMPYLRGRIALADDTEYSRLCEAADRFAGKPLLVRSWIAHVMGSPAYATPCARRLVERASEPGANIHAVRAAYLPKLVTALDDPKLIVAYVRCAKGYLGLDELLTVAARLGNDAVEVFEGLMDTVDNERLFQVLGAIYTPDAARALLRGMSKKPHAKAITALLAGMGPVAKQALDAIPEGDRLAPFARAASVFVTERPAVCVPPPEPLADTTTAAPEGKPPKTTKTAVSKKAAPAAARTEARAIPAAPCAPIPRDEPPIRRCAIQRGQGLLLGMASHGDIALAVGGQGHAIFLATTDGETFQAGSAPGKGLRGACVHEGTIWIAGEWGFLAKSADGGQSWTPVDLHTSACLFGVVADPKGCLWVAGDGGFVAMSRDGKKFTRVKGIGESIGRITSSPLGVLIPTDNPGKLYIAREDGLATTPLIAGADLMMARVTPRGTLIVVGCGGLVFRSEDEGKSFEKIDIGTSANLSSVDCLEDGRIVAVGAAGLVIVSYDDGRSLKPLAHGLSNKMLWCCIRHGGQLLIGGEDRCLLAVGPKPATQPRPLASFFVKAEAPAAPVRAEWAAPPPSTGLRNWVPPPSAPVERHDGLHVSPLLRAHLWPRRGGIATALRPLPALPEAWVALRACIWDAGLQEAGGVWGLLLDQDPVERALGARLLDPVAREATVEEDAALFRLCTYEYSFVQKSPAAPLSDASIADYLTASVGLPEALRRAFAGFTKLPYVGIGAFGRFRELMTLADEATFREARAAIIESCFTLSSRPKARSDYLADLLWAGTFLLPLGPSATTEERKLHEAALKSCGAFGSADIHASGLASGTLSTLELYLAKQKKIRHEFFATDERMYLASLLELEGVKVAPLLATMKPGEPWTTDPALNGRWCLLLAHLEHDDALEAMYGEHEKGFAWGTEGLVISGHFDKTRAIAFARKKGDAALAAVLEERCSPEAPMAYMPHGFNLATVSGATCAYEPPPASPAPEPLATRVTLAPEQTWTDEDRDAAEREHFFAVTWNGKKLLDCTPEEQEEWIALRERYAIPSTANDLVAAPRRFVERLRAIGYSPKDARTFGLARVLLRDGLVALPLLRLSLEEPVAIESALPKAMPFGDVSLAPPIIEAFSGKKLKVPARSWLLRHPRHAALAAIVLLQEKDRAPAAARALRFLARRGHHETLLKLAEGEGALARVLELLSEDPMKMPGAKLPVLPRFATPSGLPGLERQDGTKATSEETQRLLLELAFSNADEPHPGVLAARSTYTQDSRAEFAWKLFETWLALGADPKQSFCLQAVGFLGDDACGRKLAALAKVWPGQSAGARAQASLDALLNIGTDAALMQINLLSEKSRFPAFKAAAQERIEHIALARGLTRDELQDRLVPTLGLDEEGAGVLDFGPRKFTLALDEKLAPTLRGEDGKVLADLPKPAKTDDAALAKEAKAKLSGLKKDLKSLSALELARLERAMVLRRRWSLSDFQTFFVDHPVLVHLVRRLVLGAFAPDGTLRATFRVAEDRSFADVKDGLWSPPGDAFVVGIPHPLELNEETRSAWAGILADYEIIQPFRQLDRAVYPIAPSDRETISCSAGKRLPAPKLVFGLEGLGWKRYDILDGGSFNTHCKDFGDITALVSYEGSVGIGYIEEKEELTFERVSLVGKGGALKPGEIHPILYSEIVADLMKVTA